MDITIKTRRAGNRGTFYPADCNDVERFIKLFSDKIDTIANPQYLTVKPRAIIAPHAGYVYSGFTANAAHKALSNAKPKRIVVIGPGHHVYIEQISAAFTKDYETPCGNIETDIEYLNELNDRFHFIFSGNTHYREHSTETQMPFIKHYNPQAKIVELVYGRADWREVAAIVQYVLSDKSNAVVISTDLSHFYPLREAEVLDAICLNAIKHADVELLQQGCEACGITGVKAIIDTVNRLGLKTAVLDYRTSAEVSGDRNSVVGYASAVIW
jgi:AmmeMemoRadiSam system protein B